MVRRCAPSLESFRASNPIQAAQAFPHRGDGLVPTEPHGQRHAEFAKAPGGTAIANTNLPPAKLDRLRVAHDMDAQAAQFRGTAKNTPGLGARSAVCRDEVVSVFVGVEENQAIVCGSTVRSRSDDGANLTQK